MKIRRMIQSIEIERARQVVPIDLLLPGDATVCIGIQAIVIGMIPSFRSVIPNFGEYSLEFGGKTLHPIHSTVRYINAEKLTEESYHREGVTPLDVLISDNKLVTGYYRDLDEQSLERNEAFIPYRIQLIFHLQLS